MGDVLAQFPLMGRQGEVPMTRERIVTRYPYRIVTRYPYRITTSRAIPSKSGASSTARSNAHQRRFRKNKRAPNPMRTLPVSQRRTAAKRGCVASF